MENIIVNTVIHVFNEVVYYVTFSYDFFSSRFVPSTVDISDIFPFFYTYFT